MSIRKACLNGVLSIALIASYQIASAGCISIVQQPTINTNFQPLALSFRVDVSQQFNGQSTPTAVNTSYIQNIVISQSNTQQEDSCNSNTSINSNANSEVSANTLALGSKVGMDYSNLQSHVNLVSADNGYITIDPPSIPSLPVFGNSPITVAPLIQVASITSSSYQTSFSIESSSNNYVWNDTSNSYNVINYDKRIYLYDTPQAGYFYHSLDLESYLVSKVGTNNFLYSEGASVTTQNYQTLASYGFNGTATLLSVTAIPEPQTYAMLALGLVMIGFSARNKRV